MKTELLVSAGNFESLEVVIHCVGDAVYVVVKHFVVRAFANNFDDGEMVN